MTTTAFILFIIAMGEFVVIFYLLEKIRKLKLHNRNLSAWLGGLNMVGIVPPLKELVDGHYRIKEAANAPTRVEAIYRLVRQYGYGRGDAATIVDALRVPPSATNEDGK